MKVSRPRLIQASMSEHWFRIYEWFFLWVNAPSWRSPVNAERAIDSAINWIWHLFINNYDDQTCEWDISYVISTPPFGSRSLCS